MRYLGANQYLQKKLPASEFDGLQELKDSANLIRYVNLQPLSWKCFQSNYYYDAASFSSARNTNINSPMSGTYIGHDWPNYGGYTYQTFFEFDASWWQPSFQLNSSFCEIKSYSEYAYLVNYITNTTNVTWYLLGFINNYNQFTRWNTLTSAPTYRQLGSLIHPPRNSTTSARLPYEFYSILELGGYSYTNNLLILSFPIQNLTGLKSILDAAANSTSKKFYLLPVTHFLRNNILPNLEMYITDYTTINMNIYYFEA